MTPSDLMAFLSNLNVWSFLGLLVVCATYAFVQWVRMRHLGKRMDFIAHPERTPAQLLALAGHRLPEAKEPAAGKVIAALAILFAGSLAYQLGEGVTMARLRRAIEDRSLVARWPVGDFQADLRAPGLPVYQVSR
jgi:hypothetical protein